MSVETKQNELIKIALMTGGRDPHYALPLADSLVKAGVTLDFIGDDDMNKASVVQNDKVYYLNLRGSHQKVTFIKKVIRMLKYYYALMKYAYLTETKLFHILWLNKFEYFDRILLIGYYKLLGKKILFTAHNVNAGERDGTDSMLNRATLRVMYGMVDHIFVHTKKMESQLLDNFHVNRDKIIIIPYGINSSLPTTSLTKVQARKKLMIGLQYKVLLFIGNIAWYKGLDYLVSAMGKLRESHDDIKLIIAGQIKTGGESYWKSIQKTIEAEGLSDAIIQRIEFVPDEDVEAYCKAADVVVLPYRDIYQSGILFLSYNYGLPAIVADVGSLGEEIIEGETGFTFRPHDFHDLTDKIIKYFKSELYLELEKRRVKIRERAYETHSWDKVAQITCSAYKRLLCKTS